MSANMIRRSILRHSSTLCQSRLLSSHNISYALPSSTLVQHQFRRGVTTNANPTSLQSTLKLLNGVEMPVLGLGTWRAAPGEVGSAVFTALEHGYKHIDGAAVYQNEAEVGAAVHKFLEKSGQKRESLFLTSKLWNTNHEPARVEEALRASLKSLNLSYLDLYLIHWPACFRYQLDDHGQVDLYPKTKKGAMLFPDFDTPLAETWQALVRLQRQGLVRALGVSNCTADQVLALNAEFGKEGPVMNQIESHPFCAQQSMQAQLDPVGVRITAYSPLGNIHAAPPSAGIKSSASATPPPESPLHHPTIVTIAKKLGVTPAQVLIRWNLQQNRVVIPKSVRAERIAQNAEVFQFHISEEDMKQIAALNHPPTQYRFLNPTSFLRTPRKYFFAKFE